MIKRTSLVVAVALGGVVGCQRTADIQEEPALSTAPLVLDRAIQHRDWEPSVVEYPNGAVVAGPTLFPYETTRTDPNWQQALLAPWLFVGQTIISPFQAIVTPPWSEVTYRGVDVDPSYTAVPPLPPSDPEIVIAAEDHPQVAAPAPQIAEPAPTPAPQPVDRNDAVEPSTQAPVKPAPTPPAAAPRATPTPAPTPAPTQRQVDQPAAQVVAPATQPAARPPTQTDSQPELNK